VKNLPIRPLFCLASLCMVPAVLRAEPPSLLEFRAGAGVEHQTNVLQAPTQEQSDDIGVFSVGIKAEREYSLQHFKADVEAATYRYRNLSHLDYSTLNYAAAWDWKFTPALHGILSAERRQYRDITNIPATGLDEVGRRTERAELLEGIYDIDGAWRALAGVSRTSSRSTVPQSWDASPTVRSARVGGGYEWASGSSLFARFRRGDGEYKAPVFPAPSADFRENEADLQLRWIVTGKTSLDARLGHLRRTHSEAPARDFSGTVGSAIVNWAATGKTKVVAGVLRDLSSSGLDIGGTVKSTRFYVGPVWNATAHTAVSARYDRIERNWRDVPAGAPDTGREDTIRAASIGVDWTPRRIVTVSALVREERVKSTLTGVGFRNTVIGLGVKVAI
jgi:exopolysaccharide biosynthesis operon protein EpsL